MIRVLLGLLGGAVVYEIVTVMNAREGDTISEIVWTASMQRPLVPFAVGVLCGHLFWQRAAPSTPARPAHPLQQGTPRAAAAARMHAPLKAD